MIYSKIDSLNQKCGKPYAGFPILNHKKTPDKVSLNVFYENNAKMAWP